MDQSTSTNTLPTATIAGTGAGATAKTVYIIRHGVARHNVPDAQTGERPNLLDPKYTDPSLIRQGELQARVLGEHLRRRGLVGIVKENEMDVDDRERSDRRTRPIDLVVCSPLTRCLQTAAHIFPSYFDGGVTSSSEQPIFSKTTDDNINDLHVLNGGCRVFCHGDVREAYGMHYPDKRSPISQLKSKFPTVTYHPMLSEHDSDWKHDARETRQDVSKRVDDFFAWLIRQPHDNIAIVTHGVWTECALLDYCPEVLEFGKKRVYNCDVYCGTLSVRESRADRSSENSLMTLRDVQQMSFYHA